MAIITISRGTFSGGKLLAEHLAGALGYRCVDRDTVVRSAATGRVTEFDLRAALEEPPVYPGRVNHRRYIYLVLIQAALWEEVRGGNTVYHGLGGHLLLRGAPGLLRLRIIAPLEARIRMACERLNIPREDAAGYIARTDRERRDWTRFLYGLDWESPALYDLVINLERLTIEQACRPVVAAVADTAFKFDAASVKATDDLVLASRVRRALALAPSTLNFELEVESQAGCVSIHGDELDNGWQEIQQVACGVPGVNSCQLVGGAASQGPSPTSGIRS